MSGLVTVDTITAAAEAGDCATLKKMIADTRDFGEIVRAAIAHPILAATTSDAAALLLPFARQRDLLTAIHNAMLWKPKRPEVVKTILEKTRWRLGTAFHDGHVWLNQWRGGTSALHLAARDCPEVLPYLLSLRPNLEAKGHFEATALGLAVRVCNVQAVKTLLAAGANPDEGVACLCACSQSETIARLLVDAGARTTANAGTLLTLLPQAEWPRVIAQAAPANAWPHEQVTVAFEVVDAHLAQVLVATGADVAAATVGALHNPHGEVLRLVVTSLDALSPRGFYELVLRPDILEEALASGLSVNARDETGHTLLTLAATRLACAGPSVRKRVRHSIGILLDAGADRSGRQGRSSPLRGFLEIASHAQANSLRWLLLRGLRDPLALNHYMRPGMSPSAKLLRVLLQFGLSPTARDLKGRTPLHLLAANKNLFDHEAREQLEILLCAGADATIKDMQEETPLDIALRLERYTLIEGLQADRRRREVNAMRESLIATQGASRRRAMRL